MYRFLIVLTSLIVLNPFAVFSQQPKLDLSKYDLKWNQIPMEWTEGAFTGNGNAGAMIWGDYSGGLRFDIGNSEVYNGRSRVPIGKFIMNASEPINDFYMNLSIYNAVVSCNFKTTKGTVNFQTITERNTNIQRIKYDIEGHENLNFKPIYVPPIESNLLFKSLAKTNRENFVPDFTHPLNYPKVIKHKEVQNYINEEGEVSGVYYRKVAISDKVGYILLWKHIKKVGEGTFAYKTESYRDGFTVNQLKKSAISFSSDIEKPWDEAVREHQEWWHKYYEKGLIHIPDFEVAQNFYLQRYKIGSALKKNGMPLDLLGPWYRATPWPRIWANLNIQITYPIMNQLGAYEQANTLFGYIDAHNEHFINAIPDAYRGNGASMGRGFDVYNGTSFSSEYGNFLWLLYNYSQFLDFFPDDKREQEKFYPLLKRGINFVIANLEKDNEGTYNFPLDVSPEYFVLDSLKKKQFNFKNTNYNIGLLRWALKKALSLAQKYREINREIETYNEVSANLVPYQVYEGEGLMVAEGVRMELRHRHFSHLIAFYPLGLLDIDKENDNKLIQQSVAQWLSRPMFGWGYKGYTYTAACAMFARLGDGDKALENLYQYLEKFSPKNTFYVETGPVIETPMHSASATLELLVQSFSPDDKKNQIKVFTSLPSSWKDVSVKDLKVMGGHLISGTVVNGRVNEIKAITKTPNTIEFILPEGLQQKYTSEKGSSLKWYKRNEQIILSGKVKQNDVIIIR
jgi:hypothetical protein